MTKPSKKSGSLSNDEQKILQYLKQTNRPYSATDVCNNLKGEIGKTAVTKILASLQENGQLSHKVNGKQIVYLTRQDVEGMEGISKEEMEDLDLKLQEIKEQVAQMKENVKQDTQTLNNLTSTLTNDNIKLRLEELESESAKNEAKLNVLRDGTAMVSDEERKRVDAQYDEMRKAWRKRKKMFKDIISAITESGGIKPKELFEELGIEDDETVGADINQDYTHFVQ
ncbi:hypothetical protein MIR68_002896 [Amoeboaphelidium protococcarum]|nr:hypothetical protein MIR68_002896 [Amoeboaphelidium protococcarum]